jgi:hypothetical protein
MAYSLELADRIEKFLKEMDLPNLERREMFGSLSFIINGNSAVGVYKKKLLVLISPDSFDGILQNQNTAEFDVTRSYMKDWVLVDEPAFEKDEELKKWLKKGVDGALLLPQKENDNT